jgi:hypothetical protein
MRPATLQQPAEAWDGTLPSLGDYLEQLHTELASSLIDTKTAGCKGHYVRRSYRKYDVTSKMGSAIIADTHFRAACLYSGLDVSTGRFGSAAGSAGFGAWAA